MSAHTSLDKSKIESIRARESVWANFKRKHGEGWRAVCQNLVEKASTFLLTSELEAMIAFKAEALGMAPEELVRALVLAVDTTALHAQQDAIRSQAEVAKAEAAAALDKAADEAVEATKEPARAEVLVHARELVAGVLGMQGEPAQPVLDKPADLPTQPIPANPPRGGVPCGVAAWHTTAPELQPVKLVLGFGPK